MSQVEDLWENVKKGLQEGAAAAVEKADELTRLGRARLDIAAVKTSIYRLQAELGAVVHRCIRQGEDLAHSAEVQQLSERIGLLEEELRAKEAAFAELRDELAEKAAEDESATEAEENSEDSSVRQK